MLPDIRAVIATILAAVGLLMIAFSLVATYRVAQQQHTRLLQADLAQRGRDIAPAKVSAGAIRIIETPGPHVLPPIAAPSIEVVAVPLPEPERPAAVPVPEPAAAEPVPPAAVPEPGAIIAVPAPVASKPASPEPAVGGPLATPTEVPRTTAAANPRPGNSRTAQQGAAEKSKKAQAARIARQRKAAQRRARQARPAPVAPASDNNFNGFRGTFTGATGPQRNSGGAAPRED